MLHILFNTYCDKRDCFVDFKQAFNTVVHVGIVMSLQLFGVGSKFYNAIDSIYS